MSPEVRELFPQLKRARNGRRLVYLDSAATTLKPVSVIEAVRTHMSQGAANVHRGAHWLSDEATDQFERVRDLAARFVGAASKNEIVFTKGCTDGLNLLAHVLPLKAGDEILLSQMEHHSNIVPWQLAAKRAGATVKFAPVLDDGSLDRAAFLEMLSEKTRIVSLVHLSNALGTLNPLPELFAAARAKGAFTIADAAQSASAYALNVQQLGCDFLTLSGHKVFGPTGIGILYGRFDLLETLPPYQGGGSMIAEVTEQDVSFLPPPHRFEAGTPAIAEVLGLGAALQFVLDLGYDNLRAHERAIMEQIDAGLNAIAGIRRIGYAPERSHVASFLLGNAHPSDVGAILDEQGIAVRAGHHCCQPLMRRFGIPGTTRASFSVYTSAEDVRDFLLGVQKAKDLLL